MGDDPCLPLGMKNVQWMGVMTKDETKRLVHVTQNPNLSRKFIVTGAYSYERVLDGVKKVGIHSCEVDDPNYIDAKKCLCDPQMKILTQPVARHDGERDSILLVGDQDVYT